MVSGKVDPVTGASLSMIKNTDIDFHLIPLENPGLISIPLAFLLGILGTYLSKDGSSPEKYAEMEVRSLTGAGSEKATSCTDALTSHLGRPRSPGGRPRCVTKIAVPGSRAPRTGPQPPQVRSCPAGHSGSTSRSSTNPAAASSPTWSPSVRWYSAYSTPPDSPISA